MRSLQALALIAFVIVLASAFAQQPASKTPPNPALALPYTPALDVTAMDKTVDPCVDFYQYACGGWQKKNPIPPDQAAWSTYSKMQDENRELLRRILENAAAPGARRDPVNQKIGDFYGTCVDEPAVNQAGAAVLKPDLERIARLRSKDDLPEYLAWFHPQDIGIYFGQAALFRFGSTQDAKNSAEVIAEVDQGGLGLPDRDYYLKNDPRSQGLRVKYLAHVQKMLELAGDSPEQAASGAQTVLRIETALAGGSMSRVDRRDPNKTYHRMSVAELQALSPSFDWTRYIAAYKLGNIQTLNVAVPDFFKAVEAEIKTENLADWQTYLRWHMVHAHARWLSAPFVEEDFNFYSAALMGQKAIQPRWKRCVRFTDRALSEQLAQAFVEITFPREAKQRTLAMVQAVEQAMERDIRQLDWMSEPTKQQALEKLHAVINKIGYPDKWRDYSALKVVRGDLLGNGARANSFEFLRLLHKIGKPVDRAEWVIPPTMVNAHYDVENNAMEFPAAQFQPPAFDMKLDAAPNYGNAGGTIGHELTHGFDDQGRQYDAQGNLRDWWKQRDTFEFTRRTTCVIDQYSKYPVVEEVKINSKLTVGEDVADLGGLLLAWMAWKEETKNQKLKPMDGLTPEQRFFVGYAQSWCGNARPEIQRMRAMTDPHSPGRWRTNGVVSDMPEFQQAFGCKTGQPMAPENRCRVW